MRPTRLEITAFGPFGDTAVVDFDRLPTDRPFVISGPTGSGKTTLFDAMCFALYGGLPGQRARHTEVRSGFADINAVAQVALEFEIDGVIHRIERIPKQRRAKKRQKGFTDDPGRARLRRLDRTGWTTLCSKKGELEDRVHELLGIDADLFQRSVLLPQGEFQRVLNAGTDERSALLRALFGTDIYPRALARLGDERSSLGRRIAEADAASRDRRGQVTRQVAAARRHLGEVGPEHDHTSAAPSPADGPSEDVTAADGHHDGGRDNVIDLRTPEAGSPPEAGLDDKGVRTVESLRDELEEVIEGPFAGLRSAAESAGEDARTAQGRAEVARSQAADIGERARLVGIVAADRAGAAAR